MVSIKFKPMEIHDVIHGVFNLLGRYYNWQMKSESENSLNMTKRNTNKALNMKFSVKFLCPNHIKQIFNDTNTWDETSEMIEWLISNTKTLQVTRLQDIC